MGVDPLLAVGTRRADARNRETPSGVHAPHAPEFVRQVGKSRGWLQSGANVSLKAHAGRLRDPVEVRLFMTAR